MGRADPEEWEKGVELVKTGRGAQPLKDWFADVIHCHFTNFVATGVRLQHAHSRQDWPHTHTHTNKHTHTQTDRCVNRKVVVGDAHVSHNTGSGIRLQQAVVDGNELPNTVSQGCHRIKLDLGKLFAALLLSHLGGGGRKKANKTMRSDTAS